MFRPPEYVVSSFFNFQMSGLWKFSEPVNSTRDFSYLRPSALLRSIGRAGPLQSERTPDPEADRGINGAGGGYCRSITSAFPPPPRTAANSERACGPCLSRSAVRVSGRTRLLFLLTSRLPKKKKYRPRRRRSENK